MNFNEVTEKARGQLGPHCKGCPVCNGKACGNQLPGPGSKGMGDTAIRNFQKWQEIRVNMDTIHPYKNADTSVKLFGRSFDLPLFAGPVGAVKLHYSEKYTDNEYNDILVRACAANGIAAFTGDGLDSNVMVAAAAAVKKCGGLGIPTIKPWNVELVKEKLAMVKDAGAFAVSMDIDGSGLPFLKNLDPPAGFKSVEELRAISEAAGVPFIVKGVMTVNGALKAIEAGAAGIVVSNHGGRVQDQCPSTAEVLPEICDAVKGKITIIVDGGIRTGTDVFKALAIGADAVIIARPFVTAVYGAEDEGVAAYVSKIRSELEDTMLMCGAGSISDINRSMIRL